MATNMVSHRELSVKYAAVHQGYHELADLEREMGEAVEKALRKIARKRHKKNTTSLIAYSMPSFLPSTPEVYDSADLPTQVRKAR